jgi:hypothetical protein
MDRSLIDHLTKQIIAWRKDEGHSAARAVAVALELGFRHGVRKAAEIIEEHTLPMEEEALPVPPAAIAQPAE